MEKHNEKVIKFEDRKYKLNKLNPFVFSAFKVTYGKAIMDNDPEALGEQNKIILSWIVDADSGIPIYDKDTDKIIMADLDDFDKTIKLLEKVIAEIIAPLFQSTTS